MKRFVLVLCVFVLCFGLFGVAGAATSGNITVTFAVSNLSIDFSTTSLAFGTISPGAMVVSNSGISVTNSGNINESFQIRTTTSTANFSLTTAAPTTSTEFRILAMFNSAKPAIGDFDVVNDYLNENDKLSSGVAFAGDITGEGVVASNSRNLWLRLDAPTGNPASAQQTVTVTVTAIAQ